MHKQIDKFYDSTRTVLNTLGAINNALFAFEQMHTTTKETYQKLVSKEVKPNDARRD